MLFLHIEKLFDLKKYDYDEKVRPVRVDFTHESVNYY